MVKLQELHIYFKLQMRYNQFNKEQFIQKAKTVHGDKYDYIFSNYVNMHTKVKIICPEHGLFEQSPSNHCKGVNCPNCAELQRVMVFKNNCKSFANKYHNQQFKGTIVRIRRYFTVTQEDKYRVFKRFNGEFFNIMKYDNLFYNDDHNLTYHSELDYYEEDDLSNKTNVKVTMSVDKVTPNADSNKLILSADNGKTIGACFDITILKE